MPEIIEDQTGARWTRLPEWFRQDIPDMKTVHGMKRRFRASNLHTVCESARCPNLGQCWGQGVATFMILGEICTRACRFCAVKAGRPPAVDGEEPREVARAVREMNLRYVVVTSVARDDLPDEGAAHFAGTIRAIRDVSPRTKVETLIPDFSNKIDSLRVLVEAGPEVVSHNVETVRRLSEKVRSRAIHDRSLEVLRNLKKLSPEIITKSGIMLGLGETQDDLVEVFRELREAGVEILTIGQYLMPAKGKRYLPVDKFYSPAEFNYYKALGEEAGFAHVMSGPMVRSSYIAEEGYRQGFARIQAARETGRGR
jgi:lipoic acid synthetase